MQRCPKAGWFIVMVGLLLPSTLQAQGLVSEATASFPPGTMRLEYSDAAALRNLPNYGNLRQHYMGPRLQTLETQLQRLGIREGDIDELALGWSSGATEMGFYGLAAGRFDATAIARSAAAQGISPQAVGGQWGYCLGEGAAPTCVVVLSNSLGAFGPPSSLGALVEARGGQGPALNSDERFTKLVDGARSPAGIWGVAVGPAVGDWFKGWMPAQRTLQLDWSRVFQNVEALAYSVGAGERVNLDLKLDCTTNEAAMSLRQLLEGLRLAQQLVWQSQNPERPSPFEATEVEVNGRQVRFRASVSYEEIEGASQVGAP